MKAFERRRSIDYDRAMYVPPQFREERADVLAAAVREIAFGALVMPEGGSLRVSHVPMLLAEGPDGSWTLETHVARANDHWKLAASQTTSVAIFQGPSAYVSPSWYATKTEHGRVVPTWNYIVVHAHGRLEAIEDPAWILAHIGALTDANELHREEPWAIDDAPPGFVDGLARAIVGLRMHVDRREGAWKMIQHRSEGDRLGTIAGLDDDPHGRAVADVMRDLEAKRAER